ncbi:hypothetical protein DER44DRAFT_757950 [Fusarium oxysporum]|nr:hypothetical protein DER44DRAFT_757950 [Fusarium oxysporum]
MSLLVKTDTLFVALQLPFWSKLQGRQGCDDLEKYGSMAYGLVLVYLTSKNKETDRKGSASPCFCSWHVIVFAIGPGLSYL